MFIQISSGQGPVECQRVVWLLYKKMTKEFKELDLVDTESGFEKNCYKSITLKYDQSQLDSLSKWEGTVQWRAKSPFRPNHKRQNWFVKVSFISVEKSAVFDPEKVSFEAFKGSGPGGQHVNKTSTAVRAVYKPTGDAVSCSAERSQFSNKQLALLKLKRKIEERELAKQNSAEAESRLLHYRLERGNPVLTFSGKL